MPIDGPPQAAPVDDSVRSARTGRRPSLCRLVGHARAPTHRARHPWHKTVSPYHPGPHCSATGVAAGGVWSHGTHAPFSRPGPDGPRRSLCDMRRGHGGVPTTPRVRVRSAGGSRGRRGQPGHWGGEWSSGAPPGVARRGVAVARWHAGVRSPVRQKAQMSLMGWCIISPHDEVAW